MVLWNVFKWAYDSQTFTLCVCVCVCEREREKKRAESNKVKTNATRWHEKGEGKNQLK